MIRLVLVVLVVVALAGCTDAPRGPTSCVPEPFAMQGPVTLRVGYGQVWLSNATTVLRFVVPNPEARELCEVDP